MLTPYVILALVAACAVALWRARRDAPAAGPAALMLGAQAVWIGAWIGETTATTLAGKLWWDGAAWTPTVCAMSGALWVAETWVGRRRPAWLAAAALLAVTAPVATWSFLLSARGGRVGARLVTSGPVPALVYPFTWFETGVSLFLLLVVAWSAGLVLIAALRRPPGHRAGGVLLAAGLAAPYLLVDVAIVVGIQWLGQRDVSPLAFALFAPCVTLGLLRGRAAALVLVAREQLVDDLADAVLVLDARRRVVDTNPAARALLGAATAAVGRPLPAEGEAAPLVAAMHAALDDAPGTVREVAHRGRHYDVRVSTVDAGPRPSARVLVLHDVTLLHEANARLLAAQDELEQRVRARTAEVLERERQRQELEKQVLHLQRLESIGRLAGGVAHDFNNYLAAIMGNAALVRDVLPDGSPEAQDLDAVLHAARSAAGITRQLLAIGRRQPSGVGPVDVAEAVSRLEGLVGPLLGADVQLSVRCAPDTGHAAIDPGPLEQVLVNLAINARDAMPDGGALAVTCERVLLDGVEAEARGLPEASYVRLTVSDTGHGMSDEVRARVFEPFFTTKPEGVGTGLGLAIVFSILRDAGGHVEVESQLGRGTRFVVHLPRVRAAPPVEAPDGAPLRRSGAGRVLVVDDREEVRRFIARALADRGFVVRAAGGGAEALEALAQGWAPDLLLCDVRMPGMSGPALVRAARARGHLTPVLYMSGQHDGTAGLSAGDPLLPKPFTLDALVAAVQAAMPTSVMA